MSRVIKFRIWSDETVHRMEDGGMKPIHGSWIIPARIELNGDGALFDLHDEPVVYEQFTGIKDEHGVEIYEGDIVELWNSHNDDSEFHEIGQVKWMDDFAGFGVAHQGGTYLSWTQYEITLLGNIHENPDLLK